VCRSWSIRLGETVTACARRVVRTRSDCRLEMTTTHVRRAASFAGGNAAVYPGTQAGLCGRDLEGARNQGELYVAPVPRESFPWRAAWEICHWRSSNQRHVVSLDDLIPQPPARYPFEYLRASGGNHSISVRRFTSGANYSTSHRTQRSLRTVRASVEINELHTVRLP
jgi:hypothetical protein